MEKFNYLSRANLSYIEELYSQFLKNPESIDPEWKMFFEGVEFAQSRGDKFASEGLSKKELNVYNLIQAYRDYGHFEANLDPLSSSLPSSPELSLARFHLSDEDLEATFEAGELIGKPGATLREIIQHLRQCYCQTLSVQIADSLPIVREWFIQEFEQKRSAFQLAAENRKRIFQQLTRADSLEKFLHTRFVGAKRFSIEGADALIPMLENLVDHCQDLQFEELVIGMAHRGRLNVLVNFMDKALEMIFAEFSGQHANYANYDGDVKYHLGYSVDKRTPNGATCHVSLAFNPSHLEAVDPVAIGMTRAKQRRRNDTKERQKVIPVLIHGDASFAGQGVVAETLQMSQLTGYRVGGTVHIVIDNQVGFTTNPESGRSSPYSSDIAKALQIPVLHVNGDDAEAAVQAMDIAIRFRQKFKQDIVINLTCYRRHGHNEGDEPAYTQPLMYQSIKSHPTLREIYGRKLIREGVIDQAFYDQFNQERIDALQVILDRTKAKPPEIKPLAFDGLWKGFRRGTLEDMAKPVDTTTPMKTLHMVGEALTTVPKNFSVHPKLQKLLDTRKEMMSTGHVDWGMAELLSYGSLMQEGTSIRLSGQDCGRGTFSHRHSVFHDVNTGETYTPLTSIRPDKVEFCVYDSLLSEYAVLGFEYGNAISDPTFLTIWEAQFGDFANNAQVIIDQFIASGETKWYRMNGLTLLLPHGYEGQGAEHSSARLERFLQLCAQGNMQVCNMTTPAQLFHVLRRQVKRDFRKPLVIMSPKSLLRHPKVISSLTELSEGHFQEVLADPVQTDAKSVDRIVLCSGKFYYDLDKHREEHPEAARNVALIRIEQLYPFPMHQLVPLLSPYTGVQSLVWAQEEPANMGAYGYIWPLLWQSLEQAGLKKVQLRYMGRDQRASPATGSPLVHAQEQKAIIEQCFARSQS